MRRALIVLVAGALIITTGCLDQDFGDLIGSTERDVEQVVSYNETFSVDGILDPTSPPMSQEDAYQKGSTTFDVPEDSRGLTIEYDISFSSAGDQSGPEELQEVQLSLVGPSEEENETVAASSSTNGTWTFAEPTPGTWTLSFQARGEGMLNVVGVALVPVDG